MNRKHDQSGSLSNTLLCNEVQVGPSRRHDSGTGLGLAEDEAGEDEEEEEDDW